jgi:tetratricopeptide (TPR) repeat protein
MNGIRAHRPSLATRLLPVLLVLCACSSTPTLSPEQKQKLLESYTEQAQQYLDMGELDRAEGQALKGLQIDANDFKCHLIRGLTLLKRGRTRDVLEAEVLFRNLQNGGDYRAIVGLGEALERAGTVYDESARDIASGKRVSESPDPKARAEELAKQARAAWNESIEHYARALKARPGDLDALNGAMRVTALLGQLEPSLSYADRLVEAAKTDQQGFEDMLKRSGVTEDVEKRIRARIGHLADLELATHVHASTLLHRLNRDGEAIVHVDRAVEIEPERAELFSRRAELEKSLGKYEAAIADIDSFLKLQTKPFEHPDVKRAMQLRDQCQQALRAAAR